jgi:hypothetical protein
MTLTRVFQSHQLCGEIKTGRKKFSKVLSVFLKIPGLQAHKMDWFDSLQKFEIDLIVTVQTK